MKRDKRDRLKGYPGNPPCPPSLPFAAVAAASGLLPSKAAGVGQAAVMSPWARR